MLELSGKLLFVIVFLSEKIGMPEKEFMNDNRKAGESHIVFLHGQCVQSRTYNKSNFACRCARYNELDNGESSTMANHLIRYCRIS